MILASIINLEVRITTPFYCFLPSNLREQRSNVGILGIAAHSIVVSPARRRLVSVPVTKHCCLTAINRCGALCCPDFPRDRGLIPWNFFPYPAIDQHAIFCIVQYRSTLFNIVDIVLYHSSLFSKSDFRVRFEGATYGNRTRLLGLGSRCTTDVLMSQKVRQSMR